MSEPSEFHMKIKFSRHAFLKLTLKRLIIGRLPNECSKQKFSIPPAFKKAQSRHKKLCVLEILFSYRKISIR